MAVAAISGFAGRGVGRRAATLTVRPSAPSGRRRGHARTGAAATTEPPRHKAGVGCGQPGARKQSPDGALALPLRGADVGQRFPRTAARAGANELPVSAPTADRRACRGRPRAPVPTSCRSTRRRHTAAPRGGRRSRTAACADVLAVRPNADELPIGAMAEEHHSAGRALAKDGLARQHRIVNRRAGG